jgi:hypothetical protein
VAFARHRQRLANRQGLTAASREQRRPHMRSANIDTDIILLLDCHRLTSVE